MANGFDISFEGIDMNPDQVQELLKKYKKVKKYQRSNLFTIKTLDGTEDIISKMVEEAREEGF
jgi:ABC-type nitrate/sulfonate/bicarbonate transport system substrate-binding protein